MAASSLSLSVNLIVLGKTGAGKSASGNTILGREAFESDKSSKSVTRHVTCETGSVYGFPVTVHDTPGLLSEDMSEDEIQKVINEEVLQRCESDPSVFLLVIKADRFTAEEREAVEKIEKLLGEKCLKNAWILFTRGDELEEYNMTIEEFINLSKPLKNLVQKYDQRYHVFNNKTKGPSEQARLLILKILQRYFGVNDMASKPNELTALGRPLFPGVLYDCHKDSFTPDMASKPIELAALGRPLFPGVLYDCRKDSFIPGVNLWDKKSLREDLDSRPQLMTDLKFSSSDSISSKSSLLNVSASLKASFLGGLVEVGGSSKFLRDTKSSNQQCRVTMHYSETSRFDQLTMTQLGQITYPKVFEQKTATHVVTAVLYGAQAFMVFDCLFAEDENKQDIEGELNVMVKKFPGFSIEGKGAIKMTDEDNKKAENITCTFHGDVHLEQNPTTYMEALEVYKKLPTLLKRNPENAVPIKVWLYPLYLLDTKAARLEREISTRLISNTEDMMEGLAEVQRTCNDLSRRTEVNVFSDIKERLCSFQDSLSIYKMVLQKALAGILPAIRGGGMEEQSLEDILKTHSSSPFNAGLLNQWLDDAKYELSSLNSHSKTLNEINIEDLNGLKTILFDPDIDVVVCLMFTSLKYEDSYLSTLTEFLKSDKFKELDGNKTLLSVTSDRKWFKDPDVITKMRENLRLFKRFSEANKNEKSIQIIISAIFNPSIPGSSIYLYENGKMTDTKFQPVSKPAPPVLKKVLEQTVSLKLQNSPTGETVKYRVEYKQLKADSGADEQWLVIDTADEDFTLTGLVSGKQYLIRYRIVGKVGVSEASETVSPTLSSITNWTRDDFLQYSHQFTLDLNTVHKHLRLSENNRVITNTDTDHQYPDHPDRFDDRPQVLCRESVSGRCYWETEWSGKDVNVAVSYKSISKKGEGYECRLGGNDQSWSLICYPSRYIFWHSNIRIAVPVEPISRRIGVFVDHSAGTLFFYNVSHTMSLLHTVQTTFTQPLYPGFTVWPASSVKLC